MTEEKGLVVKVDGNFAYLIPSLSEACEHCALKDLCIGNTEGKIKALNFAGAKEGDLVEFKIEIGKLNKALIFLSFVGLVLLFGGALFGYYVNPLGLNPALSGGIFGIGLCSGVFFIAKLEPFSSRELYPEIKRVIKEGGRYEQA